LFSFLPRMGSLSCDDLGIVLLRALAEISMTKPIEQSEAADSSISIALCTYNGALFLREQLASIAAQTRKPAELVACDDGSNDETLAIIEQFSSQVDYPVRVIRNEKKLGSTKNFEQAIRLCRGDLIALCDQDDWWSPRKLDTLVRALRHHSAGAVFSDGALMDEGSRLIAGTLWSENRFYTADAAVNFMPRDNAISELLKRNMVTGATLMFRSSLRERLLPIAEEWVHDGWLAWMIVLHSYLIALPEPLIRYRVHEVQQVGIPGSVSARLRRARKIGAEENRRVEQQFRALQDYARSHGNVCGSALADRLDAKRLHAEFRAGLSGNRIGRWLRIASRPSAYGLYAQGWRSMFKDALA
jgi:glycosyltransferase involved in cell wall biosynthesis